MFRSYIVFAHLVQFCADIVESVFYLQKPIIVVEGCWLAFISFEYLCKY